MPIDRSVIHVQATALIEVERDPIANAANLSALLYGALPDINWAGFYFVRGQQLVLGPFQGKPAVTRIAFDAGVCGTAWSQKRTIVVSDVHVFAGHIACDSASNAEIVVPLIGAAGNVVGVLDLDSPAYDRFDESDRIMLEELAALYVSGSDLAG
jgi:L-methionine (R)-S-oxide reductase